MASRVKHFISASSAILAAATFTLAAPVKAHAYPVDCAILLCLAGGWPGSPECSLARLTFMRRITPWPIEPPLQIWRCPLSIAYLIDQSSPLQRLLEVAASAGPKQSVPQASAAVVPALFREQNYRPTAGSILQSVAGKMSNQNGVTDIDISDPVYDFVRSIRVWDVRSYSHLEYGRDGDCNERYSTNLGTYGRQGGFAWSRAHPSQAPAWVIPSRACNRSRQGRRGVGVEWTDYQGMHGFEWIPY